VSGRGVEGFRAGCWASTLLLAFRERARPGGREIRGHVSGGTGWQGRPTLAAHPRWQSSPPLAPRPASAALRQAIALTAFCTFLGTLGPGIAATREAVLTERGPLAAADYASAIILLPGVYYGISWGGCLSKGCEGKGCKDRGGVDATEEKGGQPGPLATSGPHRMAPVPCRGSLVRNALTPGPSSPALSPLPPPGPPAGVIVNAVLPHWLLAALVVAFLAISNAELIASLVSLTAARAEMIELAADIRAATNPSSAARGSDEGGSGGAAADGKAAGPEGPGPSGAARSSGGRALALRRLLTAGSSPAGAAAPPATVSAMRARLRRLHRRAARIEAVALLFPALHLPSHEDIARAVGAEPEAVFGPGYGAGDSGPDGPAAAAAPPPQLAFEKDSDAGTDCDGPAPDALGGGRPIAAPPAPAGRCGGLRRWAALQPKFEWLLVIKIVVLHLVTGRRGRWARRRPASREPWGAVARVQGLLWALEGAAAPARSASHSIPHVPASSLHLPARRRSPLPLPWTPSMAPSPEAVRHVRAKPCTPRFWFMLGIMSLLVTALLVAMATSFNAKRLWRGPQWASALAQVRAARHAPAADVEAAAPHPRRSSGAPPPAKPRNCCSRFGAWWRSHSPFIRGPPGAAITCDRACVSADGFVHWQPWRTVLIAVAAFPLAVLG
jgi:hypothetical protein